MWIHNSETWFYGNCTVWANKGDLLTFWWHKSHGELREGSFVVMLPSSCKLCHRLAFNERMWLRLWWFLVHCCSFCTITVDICVWDLLIFNRTSNITLLKKVVTCERREQVWKITMTLVMFLHLWGDCESCTCAANALSSNIEFALCVYTCLICDLMYKYLV